MIVLRLDRNSRSARVPAPWLQAQPCQLGRVSIYPPSRGLLRHRVGVTVLAVQRPYAQRKGRHPDSLPVASVTAKARLTTPKIRSPRESHGFSMGLLPSFLAYFDDG